jgi:hypothetical protein
MLVAFITNILYYSSNFYYMNPVFECEGVEGKATEDDACGMLNFCRISNISSMKSIKEPSLLSCTSTVGVGRRVARLSRRQAALGMCWDWRSGGGSVT